MYRVAVVQNESESLRSGYANVAQNLRSLPGVDAYEFIPFDSNNVQELFRDGERQLAEFDGLFISTNATSDVTTRSSLVSHRDAIQDFLERGKGVFFCYQKKLNVKVGRQTDRERERILPSFYDFVMTERPADEVDSGAGALSIVDDPERGAASILLLTHPERVTVESTYRHCVENDFKRHLYRSFVSPINVAAYDSVLIDQSYPGEPRLLLAANRSSSSGERVVVSTIAIDWEYHHRLLRNVLAYICEGVPRIALFAQPGAPDKDFENITSTAKMLKVPFGLYSRLEGELTPDLERVHNTYVLSSGWTDDEVDGFWRRVGRRHEGAARSGADFRRLYRLDAPRFGVVPLTRWTNYSSIDQTIDEVLLWLEGKYEDGLWLGGFWNTHDVLIMMHALKVDVRKYIPGICRDISAHNQNGSYDGVMGPTCGLLHLMNRLSIDYASELEEHGYGVQARRGMVSWILDNFESQSTVGREVAAQALFGLGSSRLLSELGDREKARIATVRNAVRTHIDVTPQGLKGRSEMDLVRLLSIVLNYENLDVGLNNIVAELAERQDSLGRWISLGRSANVLVALLENIQHVRTRTRTSADIDGVLFSGVEYLRAQYNSAVSSWGSSIQDTARSLHVLGLYDREFHVSPQDFFEAIAGETKNAESSVSIGRARLDMGRLIERNSALERRIEDLTQAEADLKDQVSALTKAGGRLYSRLTRNRAVGVTSLLLLISFVVSLAIKQTAALKALIQDAGSWIPVVVGAVIAVPIALWYKPKR